MESEELEKTLEALKAISDLELALAEFYHFCSEIREGEKIFWLSLEQDEQEHAQKIQEMAQMLVGGQSLIKSNPSFNVATPHNLKTFVVKSIKRLQNNQIPTDLKTLLSIAWNIEYSILEMKYNDLFSIAEQEYETLLQTIISETTAHRGKLGRKITKMRNSPPKSHPRVMPKGGEGVQRRLNQKNHILKLN